ncbi:hypothetical protein AB0M22_00550 [Nocardia sp. NPDC051756]|uniref:hypothetical protein n=1 Tax=Nocardia sp. NPDC051756 TaxID=3154751 RepID=UPI003421C17D
MPYSARLGYTGSSTRVRLPHRAVDMSYESPGSSTEFADASDRLVRHLFDVGLQLHHVLDDLDPTAQPQVRETITALVDDLDMLIRDTGLAMLALASERQGPTPADGQIPRARFRRR